MMQTSPACHSTEQRVRSRRRLSIGRVLDDIVSVLVRCSVGVRWKSASNKPWNAVLERHPIPRGRPFLS
ncbi:hypothetical protein V8C35DRAFT_161153 [Trichoderma chlorosporum]